MKNEKLSELHQQIQDLSQEVFSLLESDGCPPEKRQSLQQANSPCDPDFAKTLEEIFQRQPQGRNEFLRMQLDRLRRVSRSRNTEQIFRAFGVLEIITPVHHDHQLVHAIFSGPLKVNPWTPQEKETLAKLCGLHVRDLPSSLEEAAIYSPRQIQHLTHSQNVLAECINQSLNQPLAGAKAETPPLTSSLGLDLLQPGFASHLDLLFSTIQKELRNTASISDTSLERIRIASLRGRHLVSQIRQLSQKTLRPTDKVSVHQILQQWHDQFTRQSSTLRIHLRLEAEADRVTANPHQLQHMLFTLMASIVDGLPEARAVMGLSTRNIEKNGEPLLHVEIRDGGGLATFAGVGGELDEKLAMEEQAAALEFSDWFTLASHMNAELKLLRDEGVVTRAELYLPLHPTMNEKEEGHHIWIVEDEDRDYESLLHMLQQNTFHCTRFCSAAELREKFALAANPPDLVLLKYYLPDQRGAEVRSWLYEQDSALPVILISGLQATHPGIATANSLPSTLYLQKPFDSQDLLDMIHMNLDDTLPG